MLCYMDSKIKFLIHYILHIWQCILYKYVYTVHSTMYMFLGTSRHVNLFLDVQ